MSREKSPPYRNETNERTNEKNEFIVHPASAKVFERKEKREERKRERERENTKKGEHERRKK